MLARPAVEAGEKLGFLPGDLQEKVNPYLRPLYDALYDMLDVEKAERLLERGTIEVAPIAFMRGRTLNDAFVILDEAQNTTTEQMKMFLTRLGFGSKAVVTGDITQIDLPAGRTSGLVDAMHVGRESRASPSSVSMNVTWCGTSWCRPSSRPTSAAWRRTTTPPVVWRTVMRARTRRARRLDVVVRLRMAAASGGGLAAWLSGIAPASARGEVTVALVSDRRMRTLNRAFRGVDRRHRRPFVPDGAAAGAPTTTPSATSSLPLVSPRARRRPPAMPSAPSSASWRCMASCTCSATTTSATMARWRAPSNACGVADSCAKA